MEYRHYSLIVYMHPFTNSVGSVVAESAIYEISRRYNTIRHQHEQSHSNNSYIYTLTLGGATRQPRLCQPIIIMAYSLVYDAQKTGVGDFC